jgi:ABC-type methionine transport system ATPase subunit
MKIISAPSKVAFISSLDSSAAFLPTSGLAQAHNQFVMIFQIFNLVGAKELYKACVSVFIETNSTPSNQPSIILLTAF